MKKKYAIALIFTLIITSITSQALAADEFSGKKANPKRLVAVADQNNNYIVTSKPPNASASNFSPLPFVDAPESLPNGIEDMGTKEYLKLVQKGINDTRTEYGNKPLPLRDDLMLIAQKHALEMAKKEKMYHSKYNVNEAVRVGAYSLLQHGEGVGAAASVHNFAIGGNNKQIGLGIGAYKRMGKYGYEVAYICVVSSPDDYVPPIELK